MQRFGLRLLYFGISLFLFAGCAKQTPSSADSSVIFIGVGDMKAMSGRLLPEPKKTVSQPQAATEKSAGTKNEYEVLPEKEPAAGVIPNEGTTPLSAEEQTKQDAAALYRYLREKVALNHRGDIIAKSTYLQVEYVNLQTTRTAVKAALKDYKGTVVPIKYKKGVYTASQWNNIVKKIEAVPSVQANRERLVMSIGREPDTDFVRVRLLQDVPIMKKDIQALGYGNYVRVEVEARTPVDTTPEIVPRMPASEDIWNAAIGADLYAGEYYDNEEGVLCFQVTNIKEAKKRVGSKNPYPYGPWKFVPAKYTFVQLQKARDILWEQRDELEISTMSDDVMNNGIRVSIPNTSKITREDLIKLTGIENINLTKYDPSKVKLPQDT